MHQRGVFRGGGPQDDAVDSGGEPGFDTGHVANAAAQLHRQIDGPQDGEYGGGIDRTAGERPIEVDDVQIFEPGIAPGGGLCRRIIGINRGLIHDATAQPHTLPVLQVDRWIQCQPHQSVPCVFRGRNLL